MLLPRAPDSVGKDMDARRYLHQARLDRHLTLEQIAVRTALSPTVLRNLDDGRFERLPSGLYARSYVRAFAGEVGLDPEEALRDVEHLLPGAAIGIAQDVPALTAAAPPQTSRSIERAVAPAAVTRLGAAAIDALILLAISALVLGSTVNLVGLPAEDFLREAGLPFAAFCAIPILLYFAIFEGLGGRTPGAAMLIALAPHDPSSHADRTHELPPAAHPSQIP